MFALLTALAETGLAVVLLLGIARRVGWAGCALYALGMGAVATALGPYIAGTTDGGTAIVYTMVFITLLAFAPPARREPFSLDRLLERPLGWWRFVAEPHRVDRVHGAPQVEPVVVGETRWERRGRTARRGPRRVTGALLTAHG